MILWINQFHFQSLRFLTFQAKMSDVKTGSLLSPCLMPQWITGWSFSDSEAFVVLACLKDFPPNPIEECTLILKLLLWVYQLHRIAHMTLSSECILCPIVAWNVVWCFVTFFWKGRRPKRTGVIHFHHCTSCHTDFSAVFLS